MNTKNTGLKIRLTLLAISAVLLASPLVAQSRSGQPERSGWEMAKSSEGNGDRQEKRQEKREERRDRHQEMLERFDRDGDGQLSEAERKEARKAMHEKMKQRSNEHFDAMDANGDGVITRDEFNAFAQSKAGERQEKMQERRENIKEKREQFKERQANRSE